ncbi:MAG: hypothetical protein ABI583_01760 [Betaproteobacteria bacterium]
MPASPSFADGTSRKWLPGSGTNRFVESASKRLGTTGNPVRILPVSAVKRGIGLLRSAVG